MFIRDNRFKEPRIDLHLCNLGHGLREKLGSIRFPNLDQVKNMHNYPMPFLNPMHRRKIMFLYFKRIHKVLMKIIPHIHMFPNQIHMVKMKIQNHRSLINPKSSTQWLEPWSWHTSSGEKKRVEDMALYLFGWWKIKAMETLTPRGYL